MITERRLWQALILAGLALFFLNAKGIISISSLSLPWRCPFKLLTGLPCPGCGMTHAAKSFLQGNFCDAFSTNPLIFLFVGLVFMLAFLPDKALFFLQRKGFWKVILLLVLIWWLTRLILRI
ncbi:DUF2752 domain-containing protein [Thermodesulfatator atlanticus]|uniref:DUF2752 domain-containing protein n=1 Tax=Thermodesulfatator atlanticus TaxID=501497 RepID=UPI0003B3874D|nr:DUF2752 domain-containing protein [Thermodesulfatator atlanticus]